MTNNIAKIRAALEMQHGAMLMAELIGGPVKATKPVVEAALAALAELEKAAPQFVAGEVTQEMCQRVAASFYGSDTFANGVEMREALQLWRSELGPTLGLVEIREPTPEECERMENQFTLMTMRLDTSGGRDMFDAVRAIMWPKEGL